MESTERRVEKLEEREGPELEPMVYILKPYGVAGPPAEWVAAQVAARPGETFICLMWPPE